MLTKSLCLWPHYIERRHNKNCQSVHLHTLRNSIEYLNIKTYLNFVSFSKLENLSPLNHKILVLKSLSVVKKLHFVRWNFYFEPPCICCTGWCRFLIKQLKALPMKQEHIKTAICTASANIAQSDQPLSVSSPLASSRAVDPAISQC